MASRKQIAAALLALLAPAGGPFLTSGRRLTDPENVAGGKFPALFLIKPGERYTYDGDGETMPPTRSLDFLAVIYTDYTGGTSAENAAFVPADGMDDLLDFIDLALMPLGADALNGNRQTLGGLVYSCIVSGEPKLAPGDSIGKGEMLIPIRVTLYQYP